MEIIIKEIIFWSLVFFLVGGLFYSLVIEDKMPTEKQKSS